MISGLFPKSKYYANGNWHAAKSKASFTIKNPFDDSCIAEIPNCDTSDIPEIISAADQGMDSWQKLAAKERSNLLRAWFDLIMENQEELARLLTMEQGKPLAEARGEVIYGASFIEWFAEQAKRIQGDILESPKPNQKIWVEKMPVGISLLITPWNFPVAMITRKAGAALAAGCSVIVKPAEDTPLCALALASFADKAGIPPGVINIVTTTHSDKVVKAIMSHQKTRKVSFTGSTEVGKHLLRQSAGNLQKVSLELGGNAPFIVFEDADITAAVDGGMASKFRNSGQTCVCTNRFIVHRSLEKQFTSLLAKEVKKLQLGNGLEENTTQGPLINDFAINKVERHIQNALDMGAKLVCGGYKDETNPRLFYPTVLADVTTEMDINNEETFGPVAAIIPFDTEEEAIAIANNTNYGLAAYLYTESLSRAIGVSNALEYGMVAVNEGILSNEIGPFGGVKESGIGKEGSIYGLEEYLEQKYILLGNL